MENTYDRLTETHPDAEAVTLLCSQTDYQQVATDAMFAPVEMIEVRSHFNSDAPENNPAVSVYFDKD